MNYYGKLKLLSEDELAMLEARLFRRVDGSRSTKEFLAFMYMWAKDDKDNQKAIISSIFDIQKELREIDKLVDELTEEQRMEFARGYNELNNRNNR